MFASTFTRPLLSLIQAFRARKPEAASRNGPLPTWIMDPQLSKQLLSDTGLAVEDLGGRPTYDERLPFFMQQSAW